MFSRLGILFFILLTGGIVHQSFSASFLVFNPNQSDYPYVSFDAVSLDNSGNKINLKENLLNIKINSQTVNNFIVSNPTQTPNPDPVSVILSFDISASMGSRGIDFIKAATNAFLEHFDFPHSNIAITAFNQSSYVLSDFTSSPDILVNSFGNLTPFGSTSFNAAFTDNPGGAFQIAKHASNKPVIIVLTDGTAFGNQQAILEAAANSDATIFAVSIFSPMPELLKKVCAQTHGLYFENITESQNLTNLYKILCYLSEGGLPDNIKIDDPSCDNGQNIEITDNSSGILKSFSINVPNEKIPHLDFDGSSSINFGKHPAGEVTTQLLTITAIGRDITITGYQNEHPEFQVLDLPEHLTILKNTSYSIASVKFIPSDTAYIFDKIKFFTDACSDYEIFVSGGSDYDKKPKNTLKLDFPKGGETLIAGTDTTIRWSGVTEADSIYIEFSSDRGQNWQRLSRNAEGLNFEWNPIPKIQSDKCLIRIKKLSPINNANKIVKINTGSGKVVGAKFSQDGQSIIGANSEGFIRKWNTSNGEPLQSIVDKTSDPNAVGMDAMDVNGNDNIVIYHVAGNNYFTTLNINVQNSGKQYSISNQNETITALSFNPAGNLIVAGTDLGYVYYWEYPDPHPIRKFKAHPKPITSIKWNFDGTKFATGSTDGFISVWNDQDNLIVGVENSRDAAITSLCWDADDDISASSSLDSIYLRRISDLHPKAILFNNVKPNFAAAVNFSGNTIVSSDIDTVVKLWNVASESKFYTFTEHNGLVNVLTWDKTGKKIASGSNIGELFIWSPNDIPFEAQPIMSDSTPTTFSIGIPIAAIKDIDFKQQVQGLPADTILTSAIKNTGNVAIRIDSIKIIGSGKNDYTFNNPAQQFTITPNNSYDIHLILTPSKSGTYIDTLVYFSGVNKYYSKISANVISDILEITPQLIDYGTIGFEDNISKEVYIKNISNKPVQLNDLVIAGPDIKQFTLNENLEDLTPINPNQTDTLHVLCTPIKPGATGSAVNIEVKTPNVNYYVILSANIKGPMIDCDTLLSFKNVGCGFDTDTLNLTIKNTGNAALEIQGTSFSTTDFKMLKSITGKTIASGGELSASVIFCPQLDGSKTAELIIQTNETGNHGSNFTIKLEGASYHSSFVLNPDNLVFSVPETNRIETKEIQITNTGSLPINWIEFPVSDYFEIISIIPVITPVGESSVATVKFKGTDTEGSFTGTLKFHDSCGNTENLDLTAYVGKSDAEIDFPKFIDVGSAFCNLSKDTVIILTNTGITPLLIDSIRILGDDFELLDANSYLGATVLPNKEISLRIRFSGEKAGVNQATMTIFAVASNSIDGKFEVELHGIRYQSSMEIIPDTLLLKTVENVKKTGVIKLVNTGNTSIIWNKPESDEHFELISIEPESTNPGDTAYVTVRFLGGISGESFEGSYDFIDACGNIVKAYIQAEVKGYAQAGFKIGNYSGSPGDTIAIKLKLFSPQNDKLPSVLGYSTEISFDESLLVPLDDIQSDTNNGIRTLYLSNIPPEPQNDSTAAILHFLVTLGDTNFTPITIANSKAIDDDEIVLEESSGIFDLDGYCTAGGNRFVLNTGKFFLFDPQPNPASGIFTIKFQTIEKGQHVISIVDLAGNEISSVIKEDLQPGEYEIIADASELSQGIYYISLQTPTYFRLRKLVVVK